MTKSLVSDKLVILTLALAASALFLVFFRPWVFDSNSKRSDPQKEPPNYLQTSNFEMVEDDVFVNDKQANQGGQIPLNKQISTTDGRSVISLSQGIALSLGTNTQIKISQNEPGILSVHQKKGSVLFSVSPAVKRNDFSVVTHLGVISVTGTVFEVRVSAQSVVVQMYQGAVLITENDGFKRRLSDGNHAFLGVRQIQSDTDRSIKQTDERIREMYELGLGDHLQQIISNTQIQSESKTKTRTKITPK